MAYTPVVVGAGVVPSSTAVELAACDGVVPPLVGASVLPSCVGVVPSPPVVLEPCGIVAVLDALLLVPLAVLLDCPAAVDVVTPSLVLPVPSAPPLPVVVVIFSPGVVVVAECKNKTNPPHTLTTHSQTHVSTRKHT